MQIYACVNYFHDKNTIHKIAMECRRRRQCNTPHILIPLVAFFASFSAERLSFVRSFTLSLFICEKKCILVQVCMLQAIFMLRTGSFWAELSRFST